MSSTTTAKLGLYKETPGTQEPASMALYNANFDTLDNAVTLTGTQVLTNKTLTAPVLNGTVTGTGGFNAWTAFTPTLIQNGAVACSVAAGRSITLGKITLASLHLTASASGTSGIAIQVGAIPTAPQSTVLAQGFGWFQKSGGAATLLGAYLASNTVLSFNANTGNDVFGVNPVAQVQSGDQFYLFLVYEAA